MNKISTIGEDKMLLLKILVCGNSLTGKTSLVNKYINNNTSSIVSTIGVDYNSKNFEIEGKKIKVMIWDTAGQERFRSIISAYFRGAHGILLVFDVSHRKSFDDLKFWMSTIMVYTENEYNIILIGNKTDLEREVSNDEANIFANENKMLYFETNLQNNNISEVFEKIVNDIYKRWKSDENKNKWSHTKNCITLSNRGSRYCCY